MKKLFILFISYLVLSLHVKSQERPVLDIMLTNYKYPFEVTYFHFNSQQQDLKMAYMDIKPQDNNGKVVLLMHGKNFNGAYWKTTIDALTSEGYRVVVPDQIGFGKSSKPKGYQFSFQQLAQNTKDLLEHLSIDKISLLGHSMGGMLATRYTLMYPDNVEKLILENPIGLEDWKVVAPYTSIDEHYKNELNANYESTKAYQLAFYYDNNWKPEYDEWVYLLTGWVEHPDYPTVAWNNALTADMIFTQPVLYEFQNIKAPTLLIIGTRDRTAIGKNKVEDKSVREKMGLYQHLGKTTQKSIPNSQLIELDDIGHLPHIEAFDLFINPLKEFLSVSTTHR
ncbi:MAG TPA: alpha/beta hydrolase [Fermentimonas sp.]|nr:alpha/beta hydrolase [Fermentimonas sp.]